LRAAVRLTDAYVTDRMRPDKAIDAIDEACAHMQAVTAYPPRLEELIRQRVALIKDLARAEAERPRKEAEAQQKQREPFGALERFGAEIEALFVGAPAAAGTGPAGARAGRGRARARAHGGRHRRPRSRYRARRRSHGRHRRRVARRRRMS